MYTFKRLITIFFVLASLNIFDAAHGAPSDELILQLSSRDKEQIDDTLLMLYRGMADDMLPLVWALWNIDKEKYPTFNWPLISNDTFRIKLANLLGQWLRIKGTDRESLLPIKRYVIQQRNNPDPEVRLQAIKYTVYSDSCDLQFLSSEVLREDGIFSTWAFIGIAQILGAEAKETQEIRRKIKSKEILEYIDRIMELPTVSNAKFPDVKDFRESTDCIR
jgi:hypothetical protein